MYEGDYARGYNEVSVSEEGLRGHGVLYYRLDTPEHTAVRKMVLAR